MLEQELIKLNETKEAYFSISGSSCHTKELIMLLIFKIEWKKKANWRMLAHLNVENCFCIIILPNWKQM